MKYETECKRLTLNLKGTKKAGAFYASTHHRRKMQHKVNPDCRITISEDTTGLLFS